MKLTWFGGTTIRIHIGGAILVVDPDGAPAGIDSAELVSGADQVIGGFGAGLASVDGASWKPRKVPRLLDEGEELPAVEVWSLAAGAVLVDAIGEASLLLVSSNVPALGRWAETAVVVLFGTGEHMASLGQVLLSDSAPRLLALAGDEPAMDIAIPALRDALDGTGLVALEAGLALEV
ncbi:hypothetical protein SAMN05428969_3170 [Devosia sp. YR412]|uniref:hypothetical protein n=1 Tax=Devosia sp. YR412 TaxID=1881030 RepID=UPI0008C3B371|nr:hypothetical protein [Devosia sp. YR412]SEQ47240.1 hypothetical protein SAMN05428969_3170 [Devosia sp. YR412]